MKRWERAIFILYLAAGLLVILIVPWVVKHKYSSGQTYLTTREYGLLFFPPSFNSSIDFGVVLLELAAIGILAGSTFILKESLEKWGFNDFVNRVTDRIYWLDEEVKCDFVKGKTNRLHRAFVYLGVILFGMLFLFFKKYLF